MSKHKPGVKRGFTREIMLSAAIETARVPGGWSTLTRERIAQTAGCSDGLISLYLGDMENTRRCIMREAVRQEILEIIRQSLVAYDGYPVPKELKRRSLLSLIG